MAKPKLALIPAAQGTKLYSVLPSNGTGDFTFTRGSVATRINAQGLIENVASGQSRLDYPMIDGVQKGCPHHILEPSRTNYLYNSQSFVGFSFNNSTFFENQTISPDGTLNAGKLIENTSNTRHSTFKVTTPMSSTTNTVSVFFKKLTRRFASIITSDTTTWNTMVVVDLELGIITSRFNQSGYTSVDKIENFGNGWYRVTSSITGLYTGNELYSRFGIQNTGTPLPPPNNTYQGDGASGVYIWGAQLEVGSYPTSYIPTTTTTVTRSAETATGAGQSTTFNDSEGVLMAEISALVDDGTNREISISDGSLSNTIAFMYNQPSNNFRFLVRASGTTYVDINIILTDITISNKVAFKYKENSFSTFINGFELGSDNSGLVPTGNVLNELSLTRSSSREFYGKTKQLQYFDSALADTQLEQLTSWQSFRDMANGQLYTIE